MARWIGRVVGTLALGAAGLAVGTPPVTAAEERHVEVLVDRGAYLGVSLQEVGKDDAARLKLAEERGALVKEVQSDTPAQKAGLKEGDVIVRYQGEAIQTAGQLSRLVRETPPGRSVTLDVSRNGVVQKLQARLEERRHSGRSSFFNFDFDDLPVPPIPPEPPIPPRGKHGLVWDLLGDRQPRKLGVEYQEISGQLAKYFHLTDEHGILVTSVDEDGPAAKAGMKAGDVIVKFNGKAVRDSEEFRDEVRRAQAGQEVTVTVQREGRPLDLKLKLSGEASRRRGRTT